MNVMSTSRLLTSPTIRQSLPAIEKENTARGDCFTFSGNDDSVIAKSLVGATIGGLVSMIPASALLQNGVGSGFGPVAVIAGGALLGGVLLANADVEIGIAPG